jgi:putative membrane protein
MIGDAPAPAASWDESEPGRRFDYAGIGNRSNDGERSDIVYWHHVDGWSWGIGLFAFLFIALLVTLVVWLVWTASRPSAPPEHRGSSALEILDARYARGEIDRDEYLERRADLER